MTDEQIEQIFEIIEEVIGAEIEKFSNEILKAMQECVFKKLYSSGKGIDIECVIGIAMLFEEKKKVMKKQIAKEKLELIIALENSLKKHFALIYGLNLNKITGISFLQVLNEIRKSEKIKPEQQEKNIFNDDYHEVLEKEDQKP